LAFIVCEIQKVLFSHFPNILISELETENQKKMIVEIEYDNEKKQTIINLYKTMRLSRINQKLHDIKTYKIISFNIEYKIYHNKVVPNGKIESMVNMDLHS
jgi:hypothetical protein